MNCPGINSSLLKRNSAPKKDFCQPLTVIIIILEFLTVPLLSPIRSWIFHRNYIFFIKTSLFTTCKTTTLEVSNKRNKKYLLIVLLSLSSFRNLLFSEQKRCSIKKYYIKNVFFNSLKHILTHIYKKIIKLLS